MSYISNAEINRGRLELKLRNHIKQHRARLDLTQEALARQVEVSRQTIIAIEKERYVPSTLLAFKIARALGMRVDELFEPVEKGSGNEE
jgi:putative transcriptional regulator